jgi:type IV pilus assembly protein PilA
MQRPTVTTVRDLARKTPGFTLIELLIVVVIIGILAAIAVPKFQATKGKANFAAMRSDLHNLVTAQEGHFYDQRTYTDDLDSLQFTPTRRVQITITEATSGGWSATSTHPESYPHFCALFYGDAAPVDPATAAGIVACK